MTLLEQAYLDALAHLRQVAAKKDWSIEGDAEFHQAREQCYWAKLALVSAKTRS